MALRLLSLFLCLNMCLFIGAQEDTPSSLVSVIDFGAVGDGEAYDTQAFTKAWEAICGENAKTSTLIIPAGKKFLLQAVQFQGPCKFPSTTIQIMGDIIAPSKEKWENVSLRYWMAFSNVNNLTINGAGQLDGQGPGWWNCSQGRPCDNRHPSLALNKCNNLQLTGFTSIDSQNNHISIIGCNGAVVSGLRLLAPRDSPNTDGIDISISSTNVHIHDSTIATGDDCVAISNGCSFVYITNITCGPGHGISIGSLGKDGSRGTVEEVHVKNCTFNGTQNGARIKTWPGGSGFVRNIAFEDITLLGADHPIVINQFYCPHITCPDQPSAVAISKVSFIGVRGTSMSKYAISLNCSQSVPCDDIVLKHINITAAMPTFSLKTFCNNTYETSFDTIPPVDCSLPRSTAAIFEDEINDLSLSYD